MQHVCGLRAHPPAQLRVLDQRFPIGGDHFFQLGKPTIRRQLALKLSSAAPPSRAEICCRNGREDYNGTSRFRWRQLDQRQVRCGRLLFRCWLLEPRRATSYSADLPTSISLSSTAHSSTGSKHCSIVPIPIYSTGSSAASHRRKNTTTM